MNTGFLFLTAGQLQVAKTSEANGQPNENGHTVHRCPHCGSVLYSRRFTTCRDCGGELKGDAVLAPAQAAQLASGHEGCRDRMRRLDTAFAAIQPMGTLRL